jgi:flagellar protein FlaI
MKIDDVFKNKIMYYVKRDFLRYGKIDPLMRDPYIEDISCDGVGVPLFSYHRQYGSLKSSIQFVDENELSIFVVKLAQKCGKHISIAEPMLDATMPDGSRIQMTLSKAVTTHGSTFTIRKFRSDPITATDLIVYKTMSPEMVAFMWLAVENGVSALIAGSTAAGKTSTLNAISLFIPRESKIVSIEETREINLPHPNWIPGVVRSGFGEIINDKLAGEIDLYDLMKAALRQRPEYILVGEIRGKEAYVLFQAMATGHTTYSTVHADSAQSLIHRLEGKPIEIPRVMLQSLDIVTIQVNAMLGDQRVRRCKQIVEIVDIDPVTKEILTNEVFRWDPVEDAFYYSGKSYVLERIRNQYEMSKEEMMAELRRRVEILEWMKNNNIRMFKDVARVVATYAEAPGEFMEKIRRSPADVLKNQPQQMLDAALQVTLVKQEELQLEEKKSAVLKKKEEQPPVASSKKKKKIGLRRRDADNTYEVSKG